MIFGYCRISTWKQSIERQERNILKAYPTAKIFKEIFTGAKVQDLKELEKILKLLREGDILVFDSVSRMAREAEGGFTLYKNLFNQGIELVFLKEPHINTECYKKALSNKIQMTDTNADVILKAINEYLLLVAEEQIKIAFEQAEKELLDIRQRTKEGIETARRNGKQIGQKKGCVIKTKKSVRCKEQILKYNKFFGGSLNNKDTIKLLGINPTTFYKYKGIDREKNPQTD